MVLPVIIPGVPGKVLTVILNVAVEVFVPHDPLPETEITAGVGVLAATETVIILELFPEVIVSPVGRFQLNVVTLIAPETV